jgi:hypothetical protein
MAVAACHNLTKILSPVVIKSGTSAFARKAFPDLAYKLVTTLDRPLVSWSSRMPNNKETVGIVLNQELLNNGGNELFTVICVNIIQRHKLVQYNGY